MIDVMGRKYSKQGRNKQHAQNIVAAAFMSIIKTEKMWLRLTSHPDVNRDRITGASDENCKR